MARQTTVTKDGGVVRVHPQHVRQLKQFVTRDRQKGGRFDTVAGRLSKRYGRSYAYAVIQLAQR
jgi:hypothetical protein